MKMIKFLTPVLALLAGSAMVYADGVTTTYRDAVCEVRAWDNVNFRTSSLDVYNEMTAEWETYNTVDTAETAGQINFVIRLLNPQKSTDATKWLKWGLEYEGVSIGNEIWKSSLDKPVVGILLNRKNGAMAYADIQEGPVKDERYTDFVCSYEIMPGDLALPLLVNTNGVDNCIYFGTSDGNTDKWRIVAREYDDDGNLTAIYEAKLRFVTDIESFAAYNPEGQVWHNHNYDLHVSGININTLEYEGSEQPVVEVHASDKDNLTLNFVSTPTSSSTLYIWSANDDIAFVAKGTDAEITLEDGLSYTRKVLALTVVPGKTTYEVALQNTDLNQEGQSVDICVSPSKGYRTDNNGNPISSVLKYPAKVVAPREPTITVTVNSTQILVGSDYKQAYQGTVTLNRPYTDVNEKVYVTICPTSAVASVQAEMASYLRISDNSETGYTSEVPLTLTFTGETLTQTFYMFAFGADKNTNGDYTKEIAVAVTEVSAANNPTAVDAYFQQRNEARLQLVPDAPTVEVDAFDTNPVVGATQTFNIHVADNYRSMHDTAEGYTVKFRIGQGTKQMTLTSEGDKWTVDMAADNRLVKLEGGAADTDTLPNYSYGSAGTFENQITVVSPSGKETTVPFAVTVMSPTTPYVVLKNSKTKELILDSEENPTAEVDESDVALNVQIRLSEANQTGKTIYAYLAPLDANATTLTESSCFTNATSSAGLAIRANETETRSTGKLYIKDGIVDNNDCNYQVVFCYTSTYDATQLVDGFDTEHTITLVANNVAPQLSALRISDGEDFIPYRDPTKAIRLPSQTTARTLTLDIKDVDADLAEKFTIAVTITNNLDSAILDKTFETKPADFAVNYVFRSRSKGTAGETTRYYVHIELSDKDMEGEAIAFDYTVVIAANPSFVFTDLESVYNELNASDTVGIANAPTFALAIIGDTSNLDQPMDVRLEVANELDDFEGNVVLGGSGLKAYTQADEEIAKQNVTNCHDVAYYMLNIDPDVSTSARLYFKRLDGASSVAAGTWTITASNTTAGVECNTGVSSGFSIENEMPTFLCAALIDDSAQTNAIPATIGNMVVKYTITDVPDDMNGGVTVEWTGDGVVPTAYETTIYSNGTYTVTLPFAQAGTSFVRAIITDKDDGVNNEHTYWFRVAPTKTLYLKPINPRSTSSNTELGQSFATMAGLGYGGTHSEGLLSGSIRLDDYQLWTIGASADAIMVSALGITDEFRKYDGGANLFATNLYEAANGYLTYPDAVKFKDRMTDMRDTEYLGRYLNNHDVPHYLQPADYAGFSAGGIDESFFYAWILETKQEDGTFEGSILGGVKAVTGRYNFKDSAQEVGLPDADKEAESYPARYVAALFSKEYRPKDNMGDINHDGIPDYYAKKYKLYEDGLAYDTPSSMADDNRDGDYLPARMWQGGSVAPGVTNDWQRAGVEFTAAMEIRGFGEGLNAPYSLTGSTELELDDLELMSARMQWRQTLEENRAAYHMFTAEEVEELKLEDETLYNELQSMNGGAPNFQSHWDSATQTIVADEWFDYYVTETFLNHYVLAPEEAGLTRFGPEGNNQTGHSRYLLGELFCTLEGWLAASGWTPENPTDPTKADTDGDGMEDGYEYFFWYAANVGYLNLDAVSGMKFVELLSGRRMDETSGTTGRVITPAEIKEMFDPNKHNSKAIAGDIDNDGLANYEEILIGTNPVDWDTDQDGLPDYWEVVVAQSNPLRYSGSNNEDGDYMAYEALTEYEVFDLESVTFNTNKNAWLLADTPTISPWGIKIYNEAYVTNVVEVGGKKVNQVYKTIFNNPSNVAELVLVDLPMAKQITQGGSNVVVDVDWYVIKGIVTMANGASSTNYYLTTEVPVTERFVTLSLRADGSGAPKPQQEKENGKYLWLQAVDAKTGYPLWQKVDDNKQRLYKVGEDEVVWNDWQAANPGKLYPTLEEMVVSTEQTSNSVYAIQYDENFYDKPESVFIQAPSVRTAEEYYAVPRLALKTDHRVTITDTPAYTIVPVNEYVMTNLNAEAQLEDPELEDKIEYYTVNNKYQQQQVAGVRGKKTTLPIGTVISTVVALDDLVDTVGSNLFAKGIGDLRLRVAETNELATATNSVEMLAVMRWGDENDAAIVPKSASTLKVKAYKEPIPTPEGEEEPEEPEYIEYTLNDVLARDYRVVGHAGFTHIYYANTRTYPEADKATKHASTLTYMPSKELAAVHYQVLQRNGFDPRTGWGMDEHGDNGHVGSRFCSTCRGDGFALGSSGVSVNTKPFTDKYEYLTMPYLYQVQQYNPYDTSDDRKPFSAQDEKATITQRMRKRTTIPNIVKDRVVTKLIEKDTAETETTDTEAEEGATNTVETVTETIPGVHGADSDEDGIADGWELYVGLDPRDASDASTDLDVSDSPSSPRGDGLTAVAEFLGTEVAIMYGMADPAFGKEESTNICHSIVDKWDSKWVNKYLPTDPRNSSMITMDEAEQGYSSADTDGDGISDGAERSGASSTVVYINRSPIADLSINTSFIYGDPKPNRTTCVRGGGLSPCTTDTDLDGLPDRWEADFAGIIVDDNGCNVEASTKSGDVVFSLSESEMRQIRVQNGYHNASNDVATGVHFITHGMDGTNPNDARTVMDLDWNDEFTRTVRDFDWDGDGLQNYQEYYVQALRCFRYDMPYYPLMAGEKYPFNPASYNDRSSGLLVRPARTWDLAAQHGGTYYYMYRPFTSGKDGTGLSASIYLCTDPKLYDTDADGMDDYYELFHGLNPIAGGTVDSNYGRDIIYIAYATSVSTDKRWVVPTLEKNAHTGWETVEAWDFGKYPWLNGLPEADPDGDGLRNSTEMVTANTLQPATTHTDPSPRWMTDRSSKYSLTRQYYRIPSHMYRKGYTHPVWFEATVPGTGKLGEITGSIVAEANDGAVEIEDYYVEVEPGVTNHFVTGFVYAFEENEGFDTDRDARGDNFELVSGVLPASDPLDAQDPARRQAVYFPGLKDGVGSVMMTEDGFQSRSSQNTQASGDLFRQFTVEAWVNPDTTDDGVILERIAVYPRSTMAQGLTNGWPRANFRLGVTGGKFYGMFDNDNPAPSAPGNPGSALVTGSTVVPGTWTHLALTFDGQDLVLYENGEQQAAVPTTLLPANGLRAMLQEAGNLWPVKIYDYYPGALILGASLQLPGVEQLSLANNDLSRIRTQNFRWTESFAGFFKGYVDEVRTWDGVRTEAEIADNYKRMLTLADVKANRDNVAVAWRRGYTRAKGTLPVELIQNYSFNQLPGAVDPANVATEPAGFDKALRETTSLDDLDLTWRDELWKAEAGQEDYDSLASTVYTSSRYLPVAVNTVSMLPRYDDSAVDTPYWSKYLAGFTTADKAGVASFDFPNSANPYGRDYVYRADNVLRWWRLRVLATDSELCENLLDAYEFELRSEFLGSGDLHPMGGVFAKRCDEMWDGQGAADAWENTVTAANPVNDEDVPAWFVGTVRDYIRRLAQGLLPSGVTESAYLSRTDADSNGLPDWWQRYYGLTGGGLDDDDNDGLSNYTEYLLSEVFEITDPNTGDQAVFDPTSAASIDSFTLDYFFKLGSLYIGEVFTDHDQVDDRWEDSYGKDYTDRLVYDAHKDNDQDGWSTRSEYLYSKMLQPIQADKVQHLDVSGQTIADYPVPGLSLTVRYAQKINDATIANSDLVVYAKRPGSSLDFDAKYVVAGNATSASNSYVQVLGKWSNRRVVGTLAPGNIRSFELENLCTQDDGVFSWRQLIDDDYVYYRGTREEYLQARTLYGTAVSPLTSDNQYHNLDSLTVRYNADRTVATLYCDKACLMQFGTINLATGAYDLDFGVMAGRMVTASNDADNKVFAEDCTWRIVYDVNPAQGMPRTVYLGAATVGAIKEGKNNLIVIADTNGDGKYTPGEPFGFVRGVDVGWYGAEAEVQLTETTPISIRMNLVTGANDREAVNGELWSATGDESSAVESGSIADTEVRVRVVRSYFNGEAAKGYTRVVLDKAKNLKSEIDCFLTEADFLENGDFDIDWACLDTDFTSQLKPDITNLQYKVVFGNETIPEVASTSNNFKYVASKSFMREFDSTPNLAVAEAVSPTATADNIIKTARPTFKWRLNHGDTYTAFRIVVKNGDTFLYDSGMQPAPCRDMNGVYTWTAPIYVGDTMPAINGGRGVYANNTAYTWTVTMYNAKFRTGTTSGSGAYYLDVPMHSDTSGSVAVKARYLGPATVTEGALVRVQAFATPDFSGAPLAAATVADNTTLGVVNAQPEVNARLFGIPAGTCYLLAFIDSNGNGVCDSWESMGYLCGRGRHGKEAHIPVGVEFVTGRLGETEEVEIYIEDADTNRNCLPDAYEWAVASAEARANGTWMTDESGDTSSDEAAVGIDYNEDMVDSLAKQENSGSVTSGMAGKILLTMTKPKVAALALGFNTLEEAQAAASMVDEEASVVKITGIALNGTEVTIAYTADLATMASAAVSTTSFYVIKGDTLELPLVVKTKANLADEWTVTVTPVTIPVGEFDGEYTVDLGAGASAGFVTIELQQ